MVLAVLVFFMVLAMVAFAIDVGRLMLLRSQIQNAVDAGALAASLKLKQDPNAVNDAEALARTYVRLNSVGSAVTIPEGSIEVEVGVWDSEDATFTATRARPNAVHIFARQDNEQYSFARVLGLKTFGAPASALATSTASSLDIMMVLDLSGSMADEGRIEALRRAAPVFVDVIRELGGDDQIGVMGLSADPITYDPVALKHPGVKYNSGLHPTAGHHVGVLEQRLTTDYAAVRTGALNSKQLSAGKYTGWTGTGAALGDAAHYLANGAESRAEAERIVVLLSDGYANRPEGNGPGYARSMAAYAASQNVTVYTISLGSEADISQMQEIADMTGGSHFDATGSGEATLTDRLTQAFKDIAAKIKITQLVR